ncbi:MAG: ABC transporter permease [Actinobacteria bacterium]|nr:ABC transporter permease [Actinomycetota bacterium]
MTNLPPLPSSLTLGLRRGKIEIRQFVRQRESVVFTLLFPLILMAIFGSVFTGEIAFGVTFSQYFLAGMIATGLVNSGFQQLAINIPMERDDGSLKRLRGTPMPVASYFIGKTILVLASIVFQVFFLLLGGLIFFDIRLPSTGAKWLILAAILFIGTAGSTALGTAFSSIPKNGRGASALVTPLVIVLQFFSGVFFVFTQLPQWMQQFAALFPLKWLCQGIRSVFLPDEFAQNEVAHSWETGKTLLVLSIWFVIGLAFSIRTFKWDRN